MGIYSDIRSDRKQKIRSDDGLTEADQDLYKKEADKMIAYQNMTTVQMCCCRMLFSRADKMARRVSIHCCAPKENT